MDTLEIEVKFLIAEPEATRTDILALGGESLGRHFEHNTRYDDDQGTLLQNRHLLRLRKARQTVLTYKLPPDVAGLDEFKVYREMEVVVNDFDAMDSIIKTLGFAPHQIYEKWREAFNLADAQIVMDTLPFGEFIEIEGTPEAVRRIAGQLGLNWRDRVLHTYLEIFRLLQQDQSLAFNDLTFTNFEKQPVDIWQYADQLRASS